MITCSHFLLVTLEHVMTAGEKLLTNKQRRKQSLYFAHHGYEDSYIILIRSGPLPPRH